MNLTCSFLLCRGPVVAAFLLAGSALHAAATFEGRIEMKVDEPNSGHTQVVTFLTKDNRLRVDAPQAGRSSDGPSGGIVIMDFKTSDMYVLFEMPDRGGGGPQKVYMKNHLNQNQMNATDPNAQAGAEPVATGRSETIAGYKASEYKVTEKDGSVSSVWLASGLGNFMFPAGQNPMTRNARSNPSAAWQKLAKDGLFPLRAVTVDKNGKEKSRMEVTKIQKESLPDSVFSTDGYSEFQMPSFGGGGMNPFKH